MAVYRKHYLDEISPGVYRYKRRVPHAAKAIFGNKDWYRQHIGAVALKDAEAKSRRISVDFETLLDRIDSLTGAERTAVGTSGLTRFAARLDDLLIKKLGVSAALSSVADERPRAEREGDESMLIFLDASGAEDRLWKRETTDFLTETEAALVSALTAARKLGMEPKIGVDVDTSASRLSDLLELWATHKTIRSVSGRRHMTMWLETLTDVVGDIPVASLTTAHIRQFRDHVLTKSELAHATRVKYLTGIKTLLSVAVSEGWCERNVAADVTMRRLEPENFAEDNSRRPMLRQHIEAVLDALPKLRRAESFTWLFKVALYNGVRLGELVQLRREDVITVGDVVCLRLTMAAGSVKTKSSERDVPLHAECAGFEAFAKQGTGSRVFEKLSSNVDSVSKNFGRFLREKAGIADPQITFHSTRHSFTRACDLLNMPEPVSRVLIGHGTNGDVHAHYKGKAGMRRLKEWIDQVQPIADE